MRVGRVHRQGPVLDDRADVEVPAALGYPAQAGGTDSVSVDMFRDNNPFDAVSQATPAGGAVATATWAAPQSIDYGDYVLVVKTNKTYDFAYTRDHPGTKGRFHNVTYALNSREEILLAADIFLENFRPPTRRQLGLDYDELRS